MRTQTPMTVALAALLLCLSGCNKEEAPEASAAPAATAEQEPPPAAEEHVHAAEAPAAPAADVPAIPAGAKLSFGAMTDGQTIKGTLQDGKVEVPIKMVAEGIAVKPAGAIEAGSGHHHILIDGEPLAKGTVVPKDDTHLHFGAGQTEAVVALAPGEHTLTLQFADGIHRSYGPELSASVKVKVEGE